MDCINSKFSIVVLGGLSHRREERGVKKGLDARIAILTPETRDEIAPMITVSMGLWSFIFSQLSCKINLRDIRSTILRPNVP